MIAVLVPNRIRIRPFLTAQKPSQSNCSKPPQGMQNQVSRVIFSYPVLGYANKVLHDRVILVRIHLQTSPLSLEGKSPGWLSRFLFSRGEGNVSRKLHEPTSYQPDIFPPFLPRFCGEHPGAGGWDPGPGCLLCRQG